MPLIVVGLASAAAFTVRREGLAMVGAIVAAQLAAMIAQRAYPWHLNLRARSGGSRRGSRFLTPRSSPPSGCCR